jgi:hypothetical protein
MKAKHYKQTQSHEPVMNEFVGEALAKQAERRPATAPQKVLSKLQSLPRVRKGPRKQRPA